MYVPAFVIIAPTQLSVRPSKNAVRDQDLASEYIFSNRSHLPGKFRMKCKSTRTSNTLALSNTEKRTPGHLEGPVVSCSDHQDSFALASGIALFTGAR